MKTPKGTTKLNLLINSDLHATSGVLHVIEFINYHKFFWITKKYLTCAWDTEEGEIEKRGYNLKTGG